MRKITELLYQEESNLGHLIKQATSACMLNEALQQILNQDLPPCQVGSYIKGVLVLTTENAADATTLRYHVPTLLTQLRKIELWAGLASIKIKVKPHLPEKEVVHEEDYIPAMSDENKAQFQSLAESLKDNPENEGLVKILERLARL